ncbi:MAG: deoxyhypusine synthase [Candidatus Thermoplasmatota archaeon]|nr:deoxyhypusine synthase [Candidatus Thermoplasmatota archaeon]
MTLRREDILKGKVEDLDIGKSTTLEALLDAFSRMGGFTSSKIATASSILEKMFRDDNITFLSFPADIISTGLRGVIKDVVKKKLVDVIITTCGTLDHDIARSVSSYYSGSFEYKDSDLAKINVNRLGNVVIPEENYGPVIEKFTTNLLSDLGNDRNNISSAELIRRAGLALKDKNSILYNAAINDIPVFVPGITDGSFGSQLWSYYETHRDFSVNILEDEHMLADIIFSAKKTGALMVGGGISKHHTIWWNQFREGLNYAVYVTTAQEYDGSLSGAKLEEAISWKKVREDAEFVNVYGDATVILPILLSKFL